MKNISFGLDCETEGINPEIKTNNIIALACQIAEKTIGFDLKTVPYDKTGEWIKKFIEDATNGEYTTNGGDGILVPLVGMKKI